ncbi:C40 family peptidase [Desulfovibrio inopinatus]|uniref:C40 family peptidase n=1 Tax=Desulfovibrio inopinatus TaxID=102109 RepID=UPI00041BB579|nr:C40 family peptidase [Desulfovibrio inopinatus]
MPSQSYIKPRIVKSIIFISLMALTLSACGKKNYSNLGALTCDPKANASQAFLLDSPLKNLDPTDDLLIADKILSGDLFKLAEDSNGKDVYEKLLKTAYTQLGRRYRYGGTSPRTGFDCSGFTSWVYKKHGYKLPRTSREQAHVGKAIPKSQLRKGDLVFFRTRRRISHVGIYVSNGKFIHSPRSGESIEVTDLNHSYWGRHYAGGRRVF